MSIDPFAHMASTLAGHTATLPAAKNGRAADTKAGAMLEALRNGPRLAQELAAAAGVRSALVQPLLKHYLAKGMVQRFWDERSRRVYELNHAYEADLQTRLDSAVQLLRLNGFVVQVPQEQEGALCEH